jgi:hypothetical protein
MAMACVTCQDLWQRRLDEPSPEAEAALDRHLHACPECVCWWERARRLTEGLARLTPPRPPAGLATRLTRAVLVDQRQTRLRVRLRWAVGSALAASLLLTVALRFLPAGRVTATIANAPPQPEPSVQAEPTPPEPTPSVQTPRPEEPADVGRPMQATRDVFASMLDRAYKETDDQVTLLRPVVAPSVFDEPAHPADPPGRPLTEAGQGVAHGFEPVSGSARRAVDLFIRDLPPMGLDGNLEQ